MAERIVAINAFRPKIRLGNRARVKEVAQQIAKGCTMHEGEIALALQQLRESVIYMFKGGRSVTLDGLGTFTPQIGLDGTFRVSHKPDKEITGELNKDDAFIGNLVNRDNIGKTPDELVALWNEQFPGDPVSP